MMFENHCHYFLCGFHVTIDVLSHPGATRYFHLNCVRQTWVVARVSSPRLATGAIKEQEEAIKRQIDYESIQL